MKLQDTVCRVNVIMYWAGEQVIHTAQPQQSLDCILRTIAGLWGKASNVHNLHDQFCKTKLMFSSLLCSHELGCCYEQTEIAFMCHAGTKCVHPIFYCLHKVCTFTLTTTAQSMSLLIIGISTTVHCIVYFGEVHSPNNSWCFWIHSCSYENRVRP